MYASGYDAVPILEMMLGKVISKIRIVTFIYKGGFESGKGDLDLLFEDSSIFRFSGSNGGDLLNVSTEPWIDPYNESEENKSPFNVQRYGMMGMVDVSGYYPYSGIIRKKIVSVIPLINQFDLVAGFYLQLDVGVLCFVTQADERFIYLEDVDRNVKKLGFKIFDKA